MNQLIFLLTMTIVILSLSLLFVTYAYLKEKTIKFIFMDMVTWQNHNKSNMEQAINHARGLIPFFATVELMGVKVVTWEAEVREILENAFRYGDYLKEKTSGE